MNANFRVMVPPSTRWPAIDGCSKVAFFDVLCGQLFYINPMKLEQFLFVAVFIAYFRHWSLVLATRVGL